MEILSSRMLLLFHRFRTQTPDIFHFAHRSNQRANIYIYIYIFSCERVYFSAHDSKRYFCIHSFSFIRLIFSFAASPSYCNYQSWSYRLDGRKMKPLHPMYMAVFRNLLGHSTPHTKHIPLSFNLISFLHIVQLFPCHHILFHLFPTKMWSFYMHGQHFKCITFVNTWKWALFLIAHCAILYHLLALGFEKKNGILCTAKTVELKCTFRFNRPVKQWIEWQPILDQPGAHF